MVSFQDPPFDPVGDGFEPASLEVAQDVLALDQRRHPSVENVVTVPAAVYGVMI